MAGSRGRARSAPRRPQVLVVDDAESIRTYLKNLLPMKGFEVLLAEDFAEQRPAISPDGRWIAYQSDESGQYEVYVRPFPNVDAGKWTVSTSGGVHPVWSPDGQELFYLSPGDTPDPPDSLMVVRVETEPTFSAGTPDIVFGTSGYFFAATPRHFDVSADGQRFLMVKAEERSATQDEESLELIVVQGWFQELQRLVPLN